MRKRARLRAAPVAQLIAQVPKADETDDGPAHGSRLPAFLPPWEGGPGGSERPIRVLLVLPPQPPLPKGGEKHRRSAVPAACHLTEVSATRGRPTFLPRRRGGRGLAAWAWVDS